MFNFLRSDRPESTMRVNVFLITLSCVVLLLSIAFYIVILSIAIFKGANLPGANLSALAALIQWSPIVALIAGITALLSSIYYRKVQQTRDENSLTLNTNTMKNDTTQTNPPVEPNPNDPRPR